MLGLDIIGAGVAPSEADRVNAAADQVTVKAKKLLSRTPSRATKIKNFANKAIGRAQQAKTQIAAAKTQAAKALKDKETKVKEIAKTTRATQAMQKGASQKGASQVVTQSVLQKGSSQKTQAQTQKGVTQQQVQTQSAKGSTKDKGSVKGARVVGADISDVQRTAIDPALLKAIKDELAAYGDFLDDADMVLTLIQNLEQMLSPLHVAGLTDLYNQGMGLLNEAYLYDPDAPTDLRARGAAWILAAKSALASSTTTTSVTDTTTSSDVTTYVAQVQELLNQINNTMYSVTNPTLVSPGQALVARCNAIVSNPNVPNISTVVTQLQTDINNWLTLVSNLAMSSSYDTGGGGGGGGGSFDSGGGGFGGGFDSGGGGFGEEEISEEEQLEQAVEEEQGWSPEDDAAEEMALIEEGVVEEEVVEDELSLEDDPENVDNESWWTGEPIVGMRGLDVIGASSFFGTKSTIIGVEVDYGAVMEATATWDPKTLADAKRGLEGMLRLLDACKRVVDVSAGAGISFLLTLPSADAFAPRKSSVAGTLAAIEATEKKFGPKGAVPTETIRGTMVDAMGLCVQTIKATDDESAKQALVALADFMAALPGKVLAPLTTTVKWLIGGAVVVGVAVIYGIYRVMTSSTGREATSHYIKKKLT